MNIKKDGIYVDCTLGYGGHSSEILKRLTNGHLYAFDQDMEAIEYSKQRLSEIGDNFTIIYSNFVYLKDKKGKAYGWGVAEYSTPEKFMGDKFTDMVYQREPEESYRLILEHLKKMLPQASEEQIKKILK